MTVTQCVETACLLEASSPKAGNVHPGASFDDMSFTDFVLSSVAVGPVFDDAPSRGVGPTVLAAVRRRCEIVRVNTNLGIILLAAPLAAVDRDVALRDGIGDVLDGLTVADAVAVYEAIRLAGAGGLGRVESQDLSDEPTETLLEVMQRAADRDLIARQYAGSFADVLDSALPSLLAGLDAGLTIETAIVRTHLELLAAGPDTLIARKRGPAEATEASERASEVLAAGWPDPAGRPAFAAFDGWLRVEGHARNPGGTADLVTAGLFVGLREGIIRLPLNRLS
jgi:triphosphoribosyl-dephospho-CoA synthase